MAKKGEWEKRGKRRSRIRPQIAQIYQARARILRFWFWVLSLGFGSNGRRFKVQDASPTPHSNDVDGDRQSLPRYPATSPRLDPFAFCVGERGRGVALNRTV